ncbi:hypothetical protein [Jatrophihabitans endophyticus]|uniref:hypothetical protein n=1 Tax=Jatrophihabitans endophyticus TaxID=1206085 RepID=UPI001161072D|nr:hypothetical protein [Jatrophihabitans endophyticus]
MTGDEPLDGALRAPGVASWVLRAVTRDLRARARVDGAVPSFPRQVERALVLLQAVADDPDADLSGSGHSAATTNSVTGMEPTSVAAERAGCGERRARRLAASGRVRSHRVSDRCLLIDTDGLIRATRSEP